jgi:hypothetical protein
MGVTNSSLYNDDKEWVREGVELKCADDLTYHASGKR